MACGSNSKTLADNSIALGCNSIASGVGATSSGYNSKALAGNSTSIGVNSRAYSISGTALGANSMAHGDFCVALGACSTTDEVVSTRETIIAGHSYKFAGSVAQGTVSIGNSNSENINRTITNLAAGRIEKYSTDAINGSQLYAVKELIEILHSRLNEINKNLFK
jgi:autotransporter adhesin